MQETQGETDDTAWETPKYARSRKCAKLPCSATPAIPEPVDASSRHCQKRPATSANNFSHFTRKPCTTVSTPSLAPPKSVHKQHRSYLQAVTQSGLHLLPSVAKTDTRELTQATAPAQADGVRFSASKPGQPNRDRALSGASNLNSNSGGNPYSKMHLNSGAISKFIPSQNANAPSTPGTKKALGKNGILDTENDDLESTFKTDKGCFASEPLSICFDCPACATMAHPSLLCFIA